MITAGFRTVAVSDRGGPGAVRGQQKATKTDSVMANNGVFVWGIVVSQMFMTSFKMNREKPSDESGP